ncbi:fluoride efflux transporter CrcB [Methylobacillus caricis]|uniref:fluoride efflux transporter CrcB n=1 Tax=Methylobacillus caricis TaxID=1971611 RepID=UPI001CFF57FF|nr:fluoride efflux transporter CrcB [Methylobacillus caricis]MCB5187333.1 fluoride efflux transporter CrcB [Methylobacillus caricis]
MALGGFLAVGLGAAIGAWVRWGLGILMNAAFPLLPLGTLLANLVGGYLIGLVMGVVLTGTVLSPEARLFMVTGFLGGLTTFSTFSAEATDLLFRGEYGWAATHILTHLLGSLLLTWMGVLTVQYFRG